MAYKATFTNPNNTDYCYYITLILTDATGVRPLIRQELKFMKGRDYQSVEDITSVTLNQKAKDLRDAQIAYQDDAPNRRLREARQMLRQKRDEAARQLDEVVAAGGNANE